MSAFVVMKPVMIFLGDLLIYVHGIGLITHMQVDNAYISAGAYSEHFTDAFSFTGNPACLG